MYDNVSFLFSFEVAENLKQLFSSVQTSLDFDDFRNEFSKSIGFNDFNDVEMQGRCILEEAGVNDFIRNQGIVDEKILKKSALDLMNPEFLIPAGDALYIDKEGDSYVVGSCSGVFNETAYRVEIPIDNTSSNVFNHSNFIEFVDSIKTQLDSHFDGTRPLDDEARDEIGSKLLQYLSLVEFDMPENLPSIDSSLTKNSLKKFIADNFEADKYFYNVYVRCCEMNEQAAWILIEWVSIFVASNNT